MPLTCVAGPGSRYRIPAAASSTVTAALSASRTSGPAPLAVFFDATGTTSTEAIDTFRQCGYSFNFGESGLGNWTHSGKSKNVQRGGPLAAHVFETPGTYTVKVKARDSSGGDNDGDTDQAEVEITVSDPDTTYSGTNTICISTNTDTTGAPSGASLLTNQTSWPSWTSNRRYLLRAGQDFSSFGGITINQRTDIILGKFGTGADPIVSSLAVESGNPNTTGTSWSERIVFDSLDAGSFAIGNSAHDILLNGSAFASSGDVVTLGGTLAYYFENETTTEVRNALEWNSKNFLHECTIDASASAYGVAGYGYRAALLGNTIFGPSQHCVRLYTSNKVFIGHNRIYDCGSTQHHLKLHANGTDPIADLIADSGLAVRSYQLVVADNNLGLDGTDNNNLSVGIGPGEPSSVAVIDAIAETNVFAYDPGTEMSLGGQRLTERGNSNSTGSFTVSTSYNSSYIASGYDGAYYTGGAAITTEDPT